MSELSTAVQAVMAALLGSGGGLLTTAIRGARRFTALEEKVVEVERDLVTTQGRVSGIEFLLQKWGERAQTIDALPRYLEKLQGLVTSIQQNVGDVYTRLEGVRTRIDELERKMRSVRSDVKDLQEEKKVAVLESRVHTLSSAIDKLQDEMKEVVRSETFVSFTEEQGRQWNEMQRTLGRLEGLLKSTHPSRPTPPPIPRVTSPIKRGNTT